MKLETILLGVLLQKPSTGYDLKKFIDTYGRFLRSNTQMSQVYRALSAMETRGWVEHSIEPRPGAQDAKVHRVTPEGETVFLDWLGSPYVPPTRFGDPDLDVRLAFAGFHSQDDLLRILDTEIETRQAQILRYRNRDRYRPQAPQLPFDAGLHDRISDRAHARGAAAMDAHVEWCIALRNEIAASVTQS